MVKSFANHWNSKMQTEKYKKKNILKKINVLSSSDFIAMHEENISNLHSLDICHLRIILVNL